MLTDDGRTDGQRTTDAGVTGILLAHLRAFGSGELKMNKKGKIELFYRYNCSPCIMAIFFHFLRQNKINKAFSVLSKYRRLVPRSQGSPLCTSSYVKVPTDSVHARFNFRPLFPIYFCYPKKPYTHNCPVSDIKRCICFQQSNNGPKNN